MSRTVGIHLPRLPASHARAASSHAIQLHRNRPENLSHRRAATLNEPNYTAYIGTPRQDVPCHVYHDPAMFDDVFDKQGRLFTGRNTPKITSPLTSLGYNSLHDPHCRRLFLNNHALRDHLVHLGLLTDDLRVIANTKEQRQKIRSHELLERKEQLIQKLEEKEKQRISKLINQQKVRLPKRYQLSETRAEERKAVWEKIQKKKVEKIARDQELSKMRELEKKKARKKQLQELLDKIKLSEQTRRNAAQQQQEEAEMITYERTFGKTAIWHRESDRIHNRMIALSQTKWKKKKNKSRKLETSPTLPITIPEPLPLSSSHSVPVSREVVASTSSLEEENKKEEKEDQEEEEENKQEEKDQEEEVKEMDNQLREIEEPIETPITREDEEVPTTVQQSDVIHEMEEEREQQPVYASTLLDSQTSTVELVRLFTERLAMTDISNSGFIPFEDVYQLLESNDLALPLDHEELLHITSQLDLYGNGMIPVIQAGSVLPWLLIETLAQRMELQLQHYGYYVEEGWLQLSSPNMGYMYMQKTTGLIQKDRPDDYRPFLKDDLFEDVIVDLFVTADSNRDGYIDRNEFYSFLRSPFMNERIYTEQMETIHQLFREKSIDGVLNLEQFVPIGHTIIQVVYSLSNPSSEWIEVQSRKCNKFLYNPITNETKIPQALNSKRSQKRKQKDTKKSSKDDPSSKPPPLRRRSASSNLSIPTENNEEMTQPTAIQYDETADDSDPCEDNTDETRKLVEEVAEKLQIDLRIIDTIPEETEDQLDTSSESVDVDNNEHVTSTNETNNDIDTILQEVLELREKDN